MVNHYKDWRHYQQETAAYFRDHGWSAEIEAKVRGVRAEHSIDVWVTFKRHGIECKWAIECKLWNNKIPKEKVLALKAIVDDVGADRGLIISEQGFQSGAYDAARNSNITLISSLEDFKRTAKTELQSFSLIPTSNQLTSFAKLYCFPPGNEPHSLLYYDNVLFVGNWVGANIAIVEPKSKTVLDLIQLDNYELVSRVSAKREIRRYPPGSMTIADGRLFVAQVFSEFVLAIDIETRAIVKRIPVSGGGEGELASSPDGRKVYFASNKVPTLFIIDSATYEFENVPYPSGRGCLSISAHPNGKTLYMGIQRGTQSRCFLAIYDIENKRYEKELYLAEIINGRSDDSSPICINFDPENERLYIGMFQSRRGIYRIDTRTYEIIDNIAFKPNPLNEHFEWVDPLSQAIHGDHLLSVNRNNYELAILDLSSGSPIRSIPLGVATDGPRSVVVVRDEAIVSYPGLNGLVFIDLTKVNA